MKNMKVFDRHGYTIIESLITVMIVGVIGIVAIPRFSAAANEPMRAEAVGVLREICAAAAAVKAESGAFPALLDSTGDRYPEAAADYEFGYGAGVATATLRETGSGAGSRLALEMDCTSEPE